MASSILEQFSVTSLQGLDKGKEKGRGCYGAVYEVRLHGSPCIAKRLHDILVGNGIDVLVSKAERKAVIDRFREECELLSGLRHPNVVQFMGVHYGRDDADISLIMEYMHMDLDQCMKTYPDIPLPYKTSILRDVAYGLAYLHSIPIIHRDLNAGNVLLTESLRAKIADLGVAKLFDMDTLTHRTKSPCPGALDFMPPESFEKRPKYDTKLDNFSFGHLMLYLVNQQFPRVIDSAVTPKDVRKKQMQVAKRREALEQMGTKHPLYSITVRCLSDTPDQRPASRDLVGKMEELCKKHPLPRKNVLQTLCENQELNEKLRTKEAESRRIAQQLEADLKDSQLATAKLQKEADFCKKTRLKQDSILEELKAKLMVQVKDNSELLDQFNSLKAQHVKLVEEQSLTYEHMNVRQRQLEAKNREIEEKSQEIQKKDLIIEENCRLIEQNRSEMAHKIENQESQLAKRQLEIVDLQQQITLYQTQADMFKEDFEHERKASDMLKMEIVELKATSSLIIAGLEDTIQVLKVEASSRGDHPAVPVQPQPMPILDAAEREQMGTYKRDLEEEKRQNMLLKERIDLLSGYQEMASRQRRESDLMQKLAGLQQNMETSRASRLEQEVKRLEEEVKRLEELAQKLTLENRKLENNLADLSDASDQVPPHSQEVPQHSDRTTWLLAVKSSCHDRSPSQDSVYTSCDESPSELTESCNDS